MERHGAISVARLRHRPSKQVLQAARKAQNLSQAGDYERAASEWEKVVAADPEFSEAHGNLGAQYVHLRRPSEAAAEFQRAIALDPATAQHQTNLAVVLGLLGRQEEAEVWARHAVQLDDSSALGHYVLGCLLVSGPARLAEGVQQLQIAARLLPKAHETLAAVYHALGKEELAREERKQYGEAESAGSPQQTEAWSSALQPRAN